MARACGRLWHQQCCADPASVWLQSASQLTAELIAAWLDLHSKPCQSDAVPMSQEASSLEIEHAVMAIWMNDMPFCVRT